MVRVRTLLLTGMLLGCATLGCSSSRAPAQDAGAARRTTSFAVLPPHWVNEQPRVKLDVEQQLSSELGRARGIRVVDRRPAQKELTSDPHACVDDAACARGVGRRLAADKVVTLKLAELGDTVVVRMTVLDVKTGTQEQAHQRVVQDARAPTLTIALQQLAREAARPFAPPAAQKDPSWYERWYTWAGAAVVAVGAGIAIVVAGGGDEPGSNRNPDITVKPP